MQHTARIKKRSVSRLFKSFPLQWGVVCYNYVHRGLSYPHSAPALNCFPKLQNKSLFLPAFATSLVRHHPYWNKRPTPEPGKTPSRNAPASFGAVYQLLSGQHHANNHHRTQLPGEPDHLQQQDQCAFLPPHTVAGHRSLSLPIPTQHPPRTSYQRGQVI